MKICVNWDKVLLCRKSLTVDFFNNKMYKFNIKPELNDNINMSIVLYCYLGKLNNVQF